MRGDTWIPIILDSEVRATLDSSMTARHWHWQSADRVVSLPVPVALALAGYDPPIETGLEYRTQRLSSY